MLLNKISDFSFLNKLQDRPFKSVNNVSFLLVFLVKIKVVLDFIFSISGNGSPVQRIVQIHIS